MSEQKKKFVQLAELPKTEGWLIDGKIVPFEKLSKFQLQEALLHAETRELEYHNRSAFFSALVDKLIAEGERRGVTLKHRKTEFTKNNLKNRTKNES